MEEAPPEEQNFSIVVRTLGDAEVSEEDGRAASPYKDGWETIRKRKRVVAEATAIPISQ